MSETPEHLIDVEPEFAAQLGLSIAEVKKLSLRELSDRAFDRGLELGVSFSKALEGQGHLKLRVGDGYPTPPTKGTTP